MVWCSSERSDWIGFYALLFLTECNLIVVSFSSVVKTHYLYFNGDERLTFIVTRKVVKKTLPKFKELLETWESIQPRKLKRDRATGHVPSCNIEIIDPRGTKWQAKIKIWPHTQSKLIQYEIWCDWVTMAQSHNLVIHDNSFFDQHGNKRTFALKKGETNEQFLADF